jgi:hypothetical protein
MYVHASAKLGLSGRHALVCAIEGGLSLPAAAEGRQVCLEGGARQGAGTPSSCRVARARIRHRQVPVRDALPGTRTASPGS